MKIGIFVNSRLARC